MTIPGAPQEHEPKSDGRASQVRVLVVDDSALMRRLLSDLLDSSDEIEVVGVARDGREAITQAILLKPDVITLDVEMPEVSGLDALPGLLAAHEAPVVMVSALTQEGAHVTLQALELGAVDFMPKPERNQLAEIRASRDILVAKVLSAAASRVRRPRRPRKTRATDSSIELHPRKQQAADSSSTRPLIAVPGYACAAIGISTGGPQALSQVLPLLVPPLPPILIVQHMPSSFTGPLAERLNRYSRLTVKEAEDGEIILADHVYIAPGGRHMTLAGRPPRARIMLSDEPPTSGHRPSIDVLFQSVARVYQATALGLIMTGMGRDGVDGCKAILASGGFACGQDEATSVVYGMNKAAFLEHAVNGQFALEDLPALLQRPFSSHSEPDPTSVDT